MSGEKRKNITFIEDSSGEEKLAQVLETASKLGVGLISEPMLPPSMFSSDYSQPEHYVSYRSNDGPIPSVRLLMMTFPSFGEMLNGIDLPSELINGDNLRDLERRLSVRRDILSGSKNDPVDFLMYKLADETLGNDWDKYMTFLTGMLGETLKLSANPVCTVQTLAQGLSRDNISTLRTMIEDNTGYNFADTFTDNEGVTYNFFLGKGIKNQ
jgi:hypothetical protein